MRAKAVADSLKPTFDKAAVQANKIEEQLKPLYEQYNQIVNTPGTLHTPEAIKEAERLKKEDENRNLRVAPALDDFGGRGKLDAVTLGDMQYFKLVGNIEKAFELSADEARALLEDSARMKGRSRIFKNAWYRDW